MNENKDITLVSVHVELSGAELSYLLQMLGANKLWGADSAKLFPTDKNENETLLARGLTELKAHQWLRPSGDSRAERERWDMDRNLLHFAAILAEPEVAVVSSYVVSDDEKEVVCHYLTDAAIIELLALANGNYQLRTIPSFELLWQRIAEAFALSFTVEKTGDGFHLSEVDFATLAQAAKSSLPNSFTKSAAAVYDVLVSSERRGEIEIGRIAENQLQTGLSLTFLSQPDQDWVLYYDSPSTIMVEGATQQRVAHLLNSFIAPLFTQQMEPA